MTTQLPAIFLKHPHWQAVEATVAQIKAAGYQAVLAGGCVRDLVMGRTPNDFDIASNATPEQLAQIFPQSLEVGREFGVTILPFAGPAPEDLNYQLEIATFRKDGPYEDGRRPSSIEFASMQEDASRRDFTVNALFYDLATHQILDFVGGQEDIKKKLIRTVGLAEARFTEDKLRILRAVRFATQLDFEIEAVTWQAVCHLHREISIVSHERIHDELLKLLKSENRKRGFELLSATGLIEQIIPLLNGFPLSITLKNLQGLPAQLENPAILLAAVFVDFVFKNPGSEKSVLQQLQSLRFSNSQQDEVLWILKTLPLYQNAKTVRVAELIKILAHPLLKALETVLISYDQAADANSDWQNETAAIRSHYFLSATLPERFLRGEDLKLLGIPPGPRWGQVLEEAYNLQLEGKLATKFAAIDWAEKQFKSPAPAKV
jgi:tRNA nucleotidyltransferase/poly(A) polymerase